MLLFNLVSITMLSSFSKPVTLFHGDDKPIGSEYQIDDWRALQKNSLDLIEIPGNHFSILNDPNVRVLVDVLNRKLSNITC